MATEIDRLRSEVGELVARHGESRDLHDFERYKNDPLEFMRVELGFKPYAKQIEMIESFMANRRTVVRGCHGGGKDHCLGALALYAAFVRKMLVLVISATERQLLGQTFAVIGQLFSSRLPGELYTSDLRIGGQKRIVAMTSGSTSQLQGWHDKFGVCVLISESQSEQVEDHAFDAAIASAVDDASRIVVVGNPVKNTGRFFEACNKSTWNAIAISAFDHPNVIEQRVVIPGGPSPTWPAEMAIEFGIDSPWYVTRVLGEFSTDGTLDSLIQAKWLEPAYERWEAEGGFRPGGRIPVVGLDVARSIARDESVAAVAQGTRLHRLVAWRSRDLVNTADRAINVAADAWREWQSLSYVVQPWENTTTTIVCDAPGIGSGVIDECKRRGQSVAEYWGWRPSTIDPKKMLNTRSDVLWNIRTLLENGTLSLPRDPLLREEMLATEWSEDTKGRIVIGSKDLLRASLKRSPDRFDACAIALAKSTGILRGNRWSVGTFVIADSTEPSQFEG